MKIKDEVKYDVNNGKQWYCSIIVIQKKENGMIICPWKKSQIMTRVILCHGAYDLIGTDTMLPWKCHCGVVFSAIS